jgi:DNA processing protein
MQHHISTIELAYLQQLPFMTRARLRQVRKCAESIGKLNKNFVQKHFGTPLDDEQFTLLQSHIASFDQAKTFRYLDALNITLLTEWDGTMPFLLRHIPDPPIILYAYGAVEILAEIDTIAIVGTRKASDYALKAVEYIIDSLPPHVVVVSGGAYGVDLRAHVSAVKRGMKTIIVLGSGHRSLPERIVHSKVLSAHPDRVAILSEYWPDTESQKFMFPERNRIISGLSKAVIIVEAPERSGSLITGKHALEQGREIFCVPGSVMSIANRGGSALVNEGAYLYTPERVASLFQRPVNLTIFEKTIMEQLERPKFAEELVSDDSLFVLSSLELKGLVKKSFDGRWRKT